MFWGKFRPEACVFQPNFTPTMFGLYIYDFVRMFSSHFSIVVCVLRRLYIIVWGFVKYDCKH